MAENDHSSSVATPLDDAARLEFLAGRTDLLDEHGSPLFVLDEAELRRNYHDVRSALDDHYPESTIHFAAKASYNLGVLSVLRDEGCGVEAYARCEFAACDRAGFDPADVLLTGMNRRREDLTRALERGVEFVLVDNATELDRVADAAERAAARPSVLVRANPSMEVPTNPAIATATRESKFGLDVESGRAMAVAESAAADPRVALAGIQLHVGSQIRGTEPYAVAAEEMMAFAAAIREETGVTVDVLDLGGGFPVAYDESVPATDDIVATMGAAVRDAAESHDLPRPHLFLEPGRRLVASASTLLSTVGVIKETPYATFAVLDAGSNLVNTHWPHPVRALTAEGPEREYDLAGPLCYTGDVLREGVSLPELSAGDVVALDRVGAYSLASASQTNAQPRPGAVMWRTDGSVDVIQERETCEDVLRSHRVPADLGGE
jgi:diaminopimelate decarboxylase